MTLQKPFSKSAIDIKDIRFLIVDDASSMRKITRSILHGLGARFIFEEGLGANVQTCILTNRIDVVLLDWELPDFHGSDVMRVIRNHRETQFLPVILLTSHTNKSTIMKATFTGINEVLCKPVSPRTLYDRIYAVVMSPKPFIKTKTYFGPQHRFMMADNDEKRPRFSSTPVHDFTDKTLI